MERDKRETERVPILGDLPGGIMVLQPMLVSDISRGGVTIETGSPLPLNSLHDLRLVLDGNTVIVRGRIVHSRISDVDPDAVTYRSGVEFIDVPERIAAAIESFVASIQTSRASR